MSLPAWLGACHALSARGMIVELMSQVKADEELRILSRGVVDVVPKDEFAQKLKRARAQGRPLRVKLGADPSAPDLHLGHVVVLEKLRQFQELGHRVIFLIGDFTAMIGDPSGRSETRKPLSREEVVENARTYQLQVAKILDPKLTEVRFNSEWMGKFAASDFIRLAGQYTVARILERDDFAKRLNEQRAVGIHELLYPLIQGYDSVALRADVEVGGTDQCFNLLVAREIQRAYGVEPQAILTLPLLEGTDGVAKMSKSLGNYVGITEEADEMFGKLMSISDKLMLRYYTLLTDRDGGEVGRLIEEGKLHPKKAKEELAEEITARFHGKEAAREARDRFDRRFRLGEMPEEMVKEHLVAEEVPEEIKLPQLLTQCGLTKSNSEARRLIKQGAVRVDGRTVEEESIRPNAAERGSVRLAIMVEVGKRRACRLVFGVDLNRQSS